MTNFSDKKFANSFAKEAVEMLNKFAKEKGMEVVFDFKGGTIEMGGSSITMKIQASAASGGKKEISSEMKLIMNSMNITHLSKDGKKELLEYNPRSHKFPWIYSFEGKRYKCSSDMARITFAA